MSVLRRFSNVQFAARLHHVITVRGRKPYNVARSIGIADTALYRNLRAAGGMRTDTLAALCTELQCSADWLLGIDKNAPEPGRDDPDGWLP